MNVRVCEFPVQLRPARICCDVVDHHGGHFPQRCDAGAVAYCLLDLIQFHGALAATGSSGGSAPYFDGDGAFDFGTGGFSNCDRGELGEPERNSTASLADTRML